MQRTTFEDGVRYMRFTDAVWRSLDEARQVYVSAARETAHAANVAADDTASDASKVRALLAAQKTLQAQHDAAQRAASALQAALDAASDARKQDAARVSALEAETAQLKEQNEDLERLLRVTKAAKQSASTDSKQNQVAKDEEVQRWRNAAQTALRSAEAQAKTIQDLQSQLLALMN